MLPSTRTVQKINFINPPASFFRGGSINNATRYRRDLERRTHPGFGRTVPASSFARALPPRRSRKKDRRFINEAFRNKTGRRVLLCNSEGIAQGLRPIIVRSRERFRASSSRSRRVPSTEG